VVQEGDEAIDSVQVLFWGDLAQIWSEQIRGYAELFNVFPLRNVSTIEFTFEENMNPLTCAILRKLGKSNINEISQGKLISSHLPSRVRAIPVVGTKMKGDRAAPTKKPGFFLEST
jgi:predicted Zn-dependent protease